MAKRFEFRLEQVLVMRKRVEDVRVKELAHAKGELLKIEDALRTHSQEEGRFLEMYGEFEKSEKFNADQVMAYCDFRDWLVRREKEYRRREQDWNKEVERRRQIAVKASRERRLLDDLKEKQKRAHAQEVLGEEQRFLDEISSIAFVRRDRAQKATAGLVGNLRR